MQDAGGGHANNHNRYNDYHDCVTMVRVKLIIDPPSPQPDSRKLLFV